MNTNVSNAIAYYHSKGYSKDVAIGICAVLYVESQLNPHAVNNSGTDKGGVINPHGAYGIAQWNGPRQTALYNFARQKHLNYGDLNTQLQFVLEECTRSYPVVWGTITNARTTYQEMIQEMVSHYEMPADIPSEIAAAMANAKIWMRSH